MLTFTDDGFKLSVQDEVGIKPPGPPRPSPTLTPTSGQSIARVKASPFIPHIDSVRGFIFDVATGALTEVI